MFASCQSPVDVYSSVRRQSATSFDMAEDVYSSVKRESATSFDMAESLDETDGFHRRPTLATVSEHRFFFNSDSVLEKIQVFRSEASASFDGLVGEASAKLRSLKTKVSENFDELKQRRSPRTAIPNDTFKLLSHPSKPSAKLTLLDAP